MSPQLESGGLFPQLVALSEAAFAAGHYKAAYHALAAAANVAYDCGDQVRLTRTRQAAAAQRAGLPETDPRAYEALEVVIRGYLAELRAREHAAEREARGSGG